MVSDPFYDAPGPIVDVGAVYLYDGSTGALISRKYSRGFCRVRRHHRLAERSFCRPQSGLGQSDGGHGAGTWCSSVAGCPPTIAAANSLVGTTAGDNVGNEGITVLPNGNYVVRSSLWDNGGATNAGAVTWCGGTGATVGAISPTNSIVGTRSGDIIGDGGITVLTNGNYVVSSVSWDNGATENVGAVTWGNGAIGIAGEISSSNSLIGPQASDQVGNGGVTALTNGNYVVKSRNWSNAGVASAGAVTLGNGTGGSRFSANSLIGTHSDLVATAGSRRCLTATMWSVVLAGTIVRR
ncbi:MAG: hypothetical protein IPK98_16350 [Chloracidobacterium sp.]|nr:hypothetical protein [Chloracidobacterium sp.]